MFVRYPHERAHRLGGFTGVYNLPCAAALQGNTTVLLGKFCHGSRGAWTARSGGGLLLSVSVMPGEVVLWDGDVDVPLTEAGAADAAAAAAALAAVIRSTCWTCTAQRSIA